MARGRRSRWLPRVTREIEADCAGVGVRVTGFMARHAQDGCLPLLGFLIARAGVAGRGNVALVSKVDFARGNRGSADLRLLELRSLAIIA
jgi:hypothetical protein